MLQMCKKCKGCHEDLDIEKALGTFQMCLMHEINECNNEDQAKVCILHRKTKAYEIIVSTLKEHGLCK